MALQHFSNNSQTYHLLSFNKDGVEEPGAGGVPDSDAAIAALTTPGDEITDVFIISHGWQNDGDDAIAQYNSWLEAYNPDRADDGIRPLIIALHWPSKAWSDKKVVASNNGLLADDAPDASEGVITVPEAVEEYARSIADTDAARKALETILTTVATEPDATVAAGDPLPSSLTEAYATLLREAGVDADPADDVARDSGGGGLLADDADAEDNAVGPDVWDLGEIVAGTTEGTPQSETLLLGDGLFAKLREGLLTALRQLTFWTMKKRARTFGESGGSQLLRRIQEASPTVRVHLMGHSFGTVVVSSMVRGPGADPVPPLRPVDSMFLVQGAVSLWAFADELPKNVGEGRGYFADVVTPAFATGPIVATRSIHDHAVGKFYPLAARVSREYLLADELPRYGGLGEYGIQGAGAIELPALKKGASTAPGPLVRGKVYNIDASEVIATGDGPGGAHSDLAHRELTQLAWAEAVS